MARLPPLERGVGTDRLARWHAMGGRYIVSLVMAHALLIIWGYALTAHTNVVRQTGTLLLGYPDIMMATVAAFLLLGVGVASARAARRRMRYETWYYLHFYTYLAIALAFSHQFATGADFVANCQPGRVVSAVPDGRVACCGIASSARCAARPGTSSAWSVSAAKRRAWCPCTSAVVTWMNCVPSLASSSAGASSPVTCGGRPTHTPVRHAAS